ncbi:MAG: hypothetical protein E7656_07215, partial [Ruminococcaceae bacterium]|nr:hypothetical protein [Oscillospiraceae bacterium]
MKRFRKLTAWLLTLAMLMTFVPSFALTAQAADTAAKITGVVVRVNGTEQPVGVLNIKDGDTVEVCYQGENFDMLTNNHKYKIGAYSGSLNAYGVEVDTTVIPNTATKTYSASMLNSSTWTTISYTNAGESETVSGYTINYNNQNDQLEATPKITGVKVLINDIEQPAGEISIADSDTVTVIYIGENFENLGQNNQDYNYRIGTGTGNFYWFTIDTTATPHTATKTYTGSTLKSGSIGYTNKDEAEVIVYTINNDQNDQPELEATPKITGVKVLINDIEQPAGEISIADSDTVTVIYIGENFENLGQNNQDYNYRI